MRAAALARRRPVDPACAARSTPPPRSCTSASTPTGCCSALREQEITLVTLVATTLARLLDAGLRAPAGAALRAHRRRAGAGGAVQRARAAGVPVVPTYGLTEACSQVDHRRRLPRLAAATRDAAGTPLFCTRCARRTDGSRASRGRRDPASPARRSRRRARRRRLAAHRRPRQLDERGRLRVTGRKADTIVSGGENVAPTRGRGGARGASRRARGGRRRPPGSAVGRGRHARSSWRAPGRRARGEERCARTARARLAPLQGPQAVRARREPLPRTRSGKLLRRELHDAMSVRPDGAEPTRARQRRDRALGRGRLRLGAPPGDAPRARRARLALDDRRGRPAARPARARAGRRAGRDRACSPPSWSRRSAA